MSKRWIQFSAVPVMIAASILLATRSGLAQQVVERLPNLVPLPASELAVVVDTATGGPKLVFGTISWNSGSGPMELIAGQSAQALQDVYNVSISVTVDSTTGWRARLNIIRPTITFTSKDSRSIRCNRSTRLAAHSGRARKPASASWTRRESIRRCPERRLNLFIRHVTRSSGDLDRVGRLLWANAPRTVV